MLITYARSGTYYLGIIDFREWNGLYADTGYVDTMEYSEGNAGVTKNLKKLIVPVMLGNADCSINVYLNINQAGFTLLETIDETYAGTLGFKAVEIPASFAWNTLQVRYELVTTDNDFSPRLYVGQNIVNEITELGKSKTYGR
jgi:hypothetical protein